MVTVKIKDREGEEITIECIMLSQACGCVLNMDTPIIENCGRELLQNRNVYTKGGEVDLLIGMSMPELHKQLSFQRLQNGAVIMETRFGYCLVGSIQNRQASNYKHGEYVANQISIVTEESEEFMFRDQLQADLAGINNNDSLKNEEEVQFEKCIKLDHDVEDNRFQVELPGKYNPETFNNNREQAVERDIRLLRQLSKRSDVLVLFKDIRLLRQLSKRSDVLVLFKDIRLLRQLSKRSDVLVLFKDIRLLRQLSKRSDVMYWFYLKNK